MTIKAIIKYEDWLMLTRGKIEPKIGDKIITNSAAKYNKKLQVSIINRVSKDFIFYKSTQRKINEVWVEVKVETSDIKL